LQQYQRLRLAPACHIPTIRNGDKTGSYEVVSRHLLRRARSFKRGDGTFNPGVYIINGGGIQFGSGSVSGTGVTFYITGSSFTNKPVSHDQQRNVGKPVGADLGDLSGDSVLAGSHHQQHGAGQFLWRWRQHGIGGALDFPTTTLTFNNGATSTANVAIVARTISLQGGVGVKLNSSSPVLPAFP